MRPAQYLVEKCLGSTRWAAAAVAVAALATGGCGEDSTGAGLPFDASVYEVTGEETDPITFTFSNGEKTVTYIPMIHIGTREFYDAVASRVKAEKEDGATLYYEFVDFDVLDDDDKRKVRAMVGILPTPNQYAMLAGSGYVGQSNDDYLGLVNDKDVDVDVTAAQLLAAYEDEFGPIEVTGKDATSDLTEMAEKTLPPLDVQKIVLAARNRKVADAIDTRPDTDVVLLFGAAHGPGILECLQALDPKWKRTR